MCQPVSPNGNLSLSTMLNKKAAACGEGMEKLERLQELFKENPALEEALQLITELDLNKY